MKATVFSWESKKVPLEVKAALGHMCLKDLPEREKRPITLHLIDESIGKTQARWSLNLILPSQRGRKCKCSRFVHTCLLSHESGLCG